MSRIQSDLNTDLPRAIGSAWKVPIGRWAYFFKIVKERRFVARLHAFQDCQVQLQQFLHRVEYAADRIGSRIARDLLDPAVGQQVEIELGPDSLENACQAQGRNVRRVQRGKRIDHAAQHRRVVTRVEGEPLVDHHRSKIGIQHRRAQRILGAADDHRFIDERVLRSAQATPFRRDARAIARPAHR